MLYDPSWQVQREWSITAIELPGHGKQADDPAGEKVLPLQTRHGPPSVEDVPAGQSPHGSSQIERLVRTVLLCVPTVLKTRQPAVSEPAVSEPAAGS